MKRFKKAVVVVLDSVGCGALPDAEVYGDVGCNTLKHVAEVAGPLKMPNFQKLGLGNVTEINGVSQNNKPKASWGKMAEASCGKDTTTGHWELAGLITNTPLPTYPEGFPTAVMEMFSEVTGFAWLGNKPSSGTEILEELGSKHVESGRPIIYTSADSVFQIAAHEDVISPEELYEICQLTRDKVCIREHAVSRIIARPFVGNKKDGWKRTHRRRDFALPPTRPTLLNELESTGIPTRGIGKIGEIFSWCGVASSPHTENNMDGWDKLLEAVKADEESFIFANLVDFDMLWGHRSDPFGYGKGLEEVDKRIPELLSVLNDGDLLIFTADHGCDPTDDSTDHTREYVFLLALIKSPQQTLGTDLGVRESFTDVAATVADFFYVPTRSGGNSFLSEL